MKSIRDCYTLSNGVTIPCMGFGTYNAKGGDNLAINRTAIEAGYRYFDTASLYETERVLGQAVRESGIAREEFFIVSKLWIDERGYREAKEAFARTLERLQMDYLDLYLIHREDPCMDPYEAARALKDMKKQGLIREAGVSNFDPFKFDALQHAMEKTLVTNQIEWNPVCFEHFESGMMDLLAKERIHPMIWSPLAGGRLFTSEEAVYRNAREKIEEIAQRHQTEPAVIVYAWLMYHPVGALPISGSNRLDRLDLAIRALDVKLEHFEWYEIYTASGQKKLR